MSEDQKWLEDVLIINDASYEHIPRTIDVYRSWHDACRSLETYQVASGVYCYTATGRRAVIGFDLDNDNSIKVLDYEPSSEESRRLVLAWLRARAERMHADRRSNPGLVMGSEEAQGILPKTIEGLIAYSGGFSR